jgi:hypothetical protein
LDIVAPESLAVFFFKDAGNDALIRDYCKSNKNKEESERETKVFGLMKRIAQDLDLGIGPPVPIARTLLEHEVMAAGIDTSCAAWFLYHVSNQPEFLYLRSLKSFVRRMERTDTKAAIRRLLELSIPNDVIEGLQALAKKIKESGGAAVQPVAQILMLAGGPHEPEQLQQQFQIQQPDAPEQLQLQRPRPHQERQQQQQEHHPDAVDGLLALARNGTDGAKRARTSARVVDPPAQRSTLPAVFRASSQQSSHEQACFDTFGPDNLLDAFSDEEESECDGVAYEQYIRVQLRKNNSRGEKL